MKTRYAALLKDPRWQRRRLEIMNRDEFSCRAESCRDKKTTLNVHHIRYESGRAPWDYPNDLLITLCETCHASISGHEHKYTSFEAVRWWKHGGKEPSSPKPWWVVPLFCYFGPPVDNWMGAMTADEVVATARNRWHFNGGERDEDQLTQTRRFLDVLTDSIEPVFSDLGWKGDIREGPYYFAVPCEGKMRVGIALKQDNNGDTCIASPVPLPPAMYNAYSYAIVLFDTLASIEVSGPAARLRFAN